MNQKQNGKVAIRVVTPNITISMELEQSPVSPSSTTTKNSLDTFDSDMG